MKIVRSDDDSNSDDDKDDVSLVDEVISVLLCHTIISPTTSSGEVEN